MTLRIRDRDGRLAEVALTPRMPLLIGLDPSSDERTATRRLVYADLIRRAAERGRAVATVVVAADPDPLLRGWAGGVNCRQPETSTAPCAVLVGSAWPADAGIICAVPDDGQALPAASGLDLRHALLVRGQPGETTAGEVLRWQRAVARWAEHPSKPMCAGYVGRAEAAIADGLDTPTFVQVLRELEADDALPAGCRFETFVHLDALLGLDLSSLIGQVA